MKNQIARRNLEIEGVKELGRVNREKSYVEKKCAGIMLISKHLPVNRSAGLGLKSLE